MRTIRATCPLCTEEVDLQPDEVTLHLIDPNSATGNRYGFTCKHCAEFVVKPAGLKAVELLLEGGVELVTDEVAPWEEEGAESTLPPHPENPPSGPEFTTDDILDLHLLLQEEDWFSELEKLVG